MVICCCERAPQHATATLKKFYLGISHYDFFLSGISHFWRFSFSHLDGFSGSLQGWTTQGKGR